MLSVQEQNLVSIYHSETRTDTVHQLREALPYMDDGGAQMAQALIDKLADMSDNAFAALLLEEVAVNEK